LIEAYEDTFWYFLQRYSIILRTILANVTYSIAIKFMLPSARSPITLSPQDWSIQVDESSGCYLLVPLVPPAKNHTNDFPTLAWFDVSYWQSQDKISGTNHGRGITYFIQHATLHMVLRRYLRGGLIAKFIAQTFVFTGLTRTRVYQEIALLEYMRTCHLPVPRPIAGKISRHLGLFYRNQLLIERIPNAQDLHAYLLQQPLAVEVWTELGRIIARMHLAGVDHHDLNIENILLDQQGKLWLIDFDKCGGFNPETWPVANIARLARSIRKKQTIHSTYHVSADSLCRLLSGYTETLRNENPDTLTKIENELNTIFSCK